MATRRQFTKGMVAAIGTLAIPGCGDGTSAPAPAITGTFRAPLPAVGNTVGISAAGAGGQGIAVTRTGAATLIAVSRRCTHQGCTIGLPLAAGATLNCPCHGSRFNSDGGVAQGPAAASLATYPATIDTTTNEVVVTVG